MNTSSSNAGGSDARAANEADPGSSSAKTGRPSGGARTQPLRPSRKNREANTRGPTDSVEPGVCRMAAGHVKDSASWSSWSASISSAERSTTRCMSELPPALMTFGSKWYAVGKSVRMAPKAPKALRTFCTPAPAAAIVINQMPSRPPQATPNCLGAWMAMSGQPVSRSKPLRTSTKQARMLSNSAVQASFSTTSCRPRASILTGKQPTTGARSGRGSTE
mmetsp:Transcript_124304/g.357182  ORF Transcript_124304/g.357182 Transcript_124304/m.357182 type:complete len:220 (+) Transcript_124304:2188-2847(+)